MAGSLTDYSAQLRSFLDRSGFEPCALGGVPFWINPDSVTYHTEEQMTVAATLGGAVLYDWAALVPTWTLDGMTGTSGVAGLNAIAAMRPLPGTTNKTVSFTFPSRFSGPTYVRIRVFEDTMKPEAHLYNFYHIEMYEVSRLQPANYTRADATVGPAIIVPARG